MPPANSWQTKYNTHRPSSTGMFVVTPHKNSVDRFAWRSNCDEAFVEGGGTDALSYFGLHDIDMSTPLTLHPDPKQHLAIFDSSHSKGPCRIYPYHFKSNPPATSQWNTFAGTNPYEACSASPYANDFEQSAHNCNALL